MANRVDARLNESTVTGGSIRPVRSISKEPPRTHGWQQNRIFMRSFQLKCCLPNFGCTEQPPRENRSSAGRCSAASTFRLCPKFRHAALSWRPLAVRTTEAGRQLSSATQAGRFCRFMPDSVQSCRRAAPMQQLPTMRPNPQPFPLRGPCMLSEGRQCGVPPEPLQAAGTYPEALAYRTN